MKDDISILIVDDNQHNVQVLGGLLLSEGFKLAVANSGADALKYLDRKHPDLILLDISMPEMNGFEVCKIIKSDSEISDIPIIFISALNATDDKVKAFEVGGADYITKPFESLELLARVRTHLKIFRLNEQLIQSHKMEAVGRLAGGIAHDLNNMLQGVIGYGELIVSQDMDLERIQDIVKDMLVNAECSADLVKQLLRFSQRDVSIFKQIDINSIIRESLSFMENECGGRIDIVLELDDEELSAYVDAEHIKHILKNLTKNSVDAMPEGGTIHLSTNLVDVQNNNYSINKINEGRYVKIAFSDNGCGMKEDVQEHVFEPFFTQKDVGEGVGMGLATVFAIVKQHHGEVKLYSEENVGTTISIYLPVHPDKSINIDRKAAGKHKPPEKKKEQDARTVLIVEDNLSINKLAQLIFREKGYNTLSASNGKDAIEVFRKNKDVVDVMLVDIVTPDLKGPEVYEKICQEKKVAVVFCSGYEREHLEEKYDFQIPGEIIKKPYTETELINAVEKALGESNE